MASTINASTSSGLVNTADTSGILQLQTANTAALTITAAQNVGIGTASPSALLHIYGNANTSNVFLSNAATLAAGGGGLTLSIDNSLNATLTNAKAGYVSFGTSNVEQMRIDSSGNVGIGTTSPADKLEVSRVSSSNSTGGLSLTNSDASGYGSGVTWRLKLDAVNIVNAGRIYVEAGSATATFMPFQTAIGSTVAERMRINSSGFVKASNTGSYNNSTAAYPEFNTDQSNQYAFYVGVTNASYAADALTTSFTQRTASSSFSAFKIYTSGGNTLSYIRGDGNAYTDGTWNNNGADYAEFFESANGQALTLGATVVLDGNKVREATDQDDVKNIIGVVRPKEPSKASMIVGNTAWNKWSNKYLSDDFDRYIMEDHDVVEWTDENGKTHSYESQNIPSSVTVPSNAIRKTHDENGVKYQHYKVNPDWNPEAEYVNRENRPEWNIIGLLGQVKLLKDKPVGDRWIKMRDVSDSVEEWFIR